MNKFKTTQIAESESSSSRGSIFSLKPTRKCQKHQIPKVQIDFDSFIQELESQIKLKASLTKQQKRLSNLFSTPNNQSLFDTMVSQSSQGLQQGSNQESQIKITPPNKEFFVAIPQTNKCFICKEQFENYLEHISSYGHKKNQKAQSLCKDNGKTMLDLAIANLINSISQKHNFGSQQIEIRGSKRQRTEPVVQSSNFLSTIKKIKCGQNNTPIYTNSFQSTTIIHQNYLL